MALSVSPEPDQPEASGAVDEGLLDLIEGIRHPALVYHAGGRIAAANRAATDLLGGELVGLTIDQLLVRYGGRLPNGRPMVPGDLPVTRALRGEIVAHGEQIELTLPDGSTFYALVTSAPVVVDGTVVAALSVWYDVAAIAHDLAGGQKPDRGA